MTVVLLVTVIGAIALACSSAAVRRRSSSR